MFDLVVTDEVVGYAEGLLAEHNFGRRGIADGSRKEQLTGLIGQVMIQDLFGHPRTDGRGGPDGGVDLVFHGLTIDVKTMGRTHRPRAEWVNNFTALQEHFPTQVLLFCSLNWKVNTLTVCGWTLKDLFLRSATMSLKGTERFRDDGSSFLTEADLYEIPNSSLYRARSLTGMRNDMHAIAIAEGKCTCAA